MKTSRSPGADHRHGRRKKGTSMEDFVHIRLRVTVSDEDALAQSRLRLSRMCQNKVVKQEIIETLSHIGLDVQDVEVLAAEDTKAGGEA